MASPTVVDRVRAALAHGGPAVADDVLDEFVSRLDAAYFAQWSPEDIAGHVRLAAELTLAAPARLRVRPLEAGRSEITVVAYDHFGEFSLICGLLAASGLSIESGHVHTFAPRAAEAPRARRPAGGRRRTGDRQFRKIVDVFRVVSRDGAAPDAARLERELQEVVRRLGAGEMEAARERLNRRLAESLSAASEPDASDARLREALAPIEITFDNGASSPWTVMDVRGRDTPGFLYALANALALRGIYIHRVEIESVGTEARDRFWIAQRHVDRIEDPAQQQALRVGVALIKQFTHLLPWAPDPALALRYFDQFVDRAMAAGPEALGVLGRPDGLRQLAQLFGSSAFLWEDFLRMQFDHLRPLLREWSARELLSREALGRALRARLEGTASAAERKRELNEFKDEQMLLIDMKHLLDPTVTLERFAEGLTDLADAVVEEAVGICYAVLVEKHGRPREAGGRECPVAVFGLGKFGGREMGYASDIELLIVYGGPGQTQKTRIENGQFFEELVGALTDLIAAREEGIFHVDLRLRPHGGKGPLASPLESIREYYRPGGGAAPFERQALIKLRPVAGAGELGEAVLAHRDAFVWGEAPWDRADALHLRERQARELVPRGRFNVKYSRGALVDVEYAAQYLQLQHGRAHPALRTPSTLTALDRLRDAALLSLEAHRDLRDAYIFWRRVADALRMVRGNARDLLLPEAGSPEHGALARRLGYTGAWTEVSDALTADVERHRRRARDFFDSFRAS